MEEKNVTEALGPDGWEVPDVSEVYDLGKARGFTGKIIEEAQSAGLNLLELRDACEWVAASCSGRMAAALESLAIVPPAVESQPLEELPEPDGGGDGGCHDETGEGTGGVDECEESHS